MRRSVLRSVDQALCDDSLGEGDVFVRFLLGLHVGGEKTSPIRI